MTSFPHRTSACTEPTPRPLLRSMGRGLRGRCPCCGEGRLFRAFLKVADHCPRCDEALHHHEADDAPAYFVIVIVGHMVVPAALALEVAAAPPYWLHFLVWVPLTLGLSIGLLQPVKGVIVAWQWACRMHGFERKSSTPPSPGGERSDMAQRVSS